MADRLPWFKCEPTKLLGALAGMTPDEGYAYTVILLRIYETGGPISDTSKALSRRTGMTERKVMAALESLAAAGKIQRADGEIDCAKTHEFLNDREKQISDAQSAGKTSAKNRADKRQQNQQTEATGVQRISTDGQRHVNDKEEDRELELIPPSETTSLRPPRGRADARPDSRGSRIPPDWAPTDRHRLIGKQGGLVNGTFEAFVLEFRNFWESKPGKDGRKVDWDKTFENRLNDAQARNRVIANYSATVRISARREISASEIWSVA